MRAITPDRTEKIHRVVTGALSYEASWFTNGIHGITDRAAPGFECNHPVTGHGDGSSGGGAGAAVEPAAQAGDGRLRDALFRVRQDREAGATRGGGSARGETS